MKNALILMLGLFICIELSAQQPTPEPVLEAFAERMPDVATPFWEAREGAFVAMFPHTDGLKKMFFEEDGTWVETRTRLQLASMPIGVQRFVEAHYGEADVTYMGKVEQSNRTTYRVESELDNSIVIKSLNEKGTLLKEDRIELNARKTIHVVGFTPQ